LLFCIALPALAAERRAFCSRYPTAFAAARFELDPALEPQVTIMKRGSDTVEEYRVGGKLYMLKVTRPRGTVLSDRRKRRWQDDAPEGLDSASVRDVTIHSW